ncbi:Plasmodium vivax Vir protein, putative [Plasmodium vivax]|nr:Plasmodium vivax Vir protein, putative [Plasmodium vivax]
MSKTHGDKFLEELERKYPFLKSLSLSSAYYSFWLDHQDKSNISQNCNFFLAQNHPDICNYSSLCTTFQNALTRIHIMQILHSSLNISKRCEYLSYWIYDNIMKSKSCDNNEQFYQKLNDLKVKYSTIHNICNIKNFEIGIKGFNKKKKLYLLGEILNLIENESKSISRAMKPFYNQYFGECANIYKEIVSEDTCEINKYYNSELTEFKKNFDAAKSFLIKNDVDITYDLITYNEPVCPEQSQSVQGATGESEQGEKVGSEELGEKAGTEEQRGAGLERAGAEVTDQAGQHAQQSASGVEPELGTGTELLQPPGEDSLNGEGSSVAGIGGDTSESVAPKSVSTIGATLAGSSLFLLMMYKYTPLGSWVSTKILRKDKLMDNMNKNNYELLLNDIGNREGSINDTMYNIRYNNISNR